MALFVKNGDGAETPVEWSRTADRRTEGEKKGEEKRRTREPERMGRAYRKTVPLP